MSRRFALVIGNSEYDDQTLSKLKTPEADVHALATALRDPQIGGFDEVQEMTNQAGDAVRRAVSAFFLQKKTDDLLLMYFSGHGVLDSQGRLFLAVKDTQRELLNATAIPATFVTDDMDACRSKRQILILDCCHSGAFARGAKGDAPAVTQATFEGNGTGRVVLTASNSTQYALEGDQVVEQASFSLFTNYLLEGLTTGEADSAQDGKITLDEWYDYAHDRVVSTTPDQEPSKWVYNQQGELVIARSPKQPDLPEELKQAIQSPFVAVRAEAAGELQRLLNGSNPALAQAAYQALQDLAAHDDSQRIRSSAGSALTAYDPLWHLREPGQFLTKEQIERERSGGEEAKQKAEADRLARQQVEEARLASEKAAQERLAQEKAEAERLSREKAEAEQLAQEKAEAERLARQKVEAERLERQRAEAQRQAREQEERGRFAGQQTQAGPGTSFHCELPSERIRSGESAKMLIRGLGQMPASLTIDFIDPQGGLSFTTHGEQVTVQPGQSTLFEFRAAPRQRLLVGQAKTYPFNVRVTASTGEVQTLGGDVLARPLAPIWAVPLAAVLLCCLAVYGIYLVIPHPSPSSPVAGADATATYMAGPVAGATHTSPVNEPTRAAGPVVVSDHTPTAETNISATPTSAVPPPTAYAMRIVFGSNRDGNWEIYMMDGDENHLTRLTDNPAEDTFPVWSPDGTKIAFHSDRAGNFDIYVMNADGSGLTQLTNNPKADTFPSWSPDGQKIAFQSKRDGNKEIYVMNADGSNQMRLTNNSVDDINPTWSPDGKWIVFSSVVDGGIQLYMMNADGTQQHPLTHGTELYNFPVFSPDGQWLAYDNSTQGIEKIAKVAIDASGNIGEKIGITDTSFNATHPHWSPDGSFIYFTSAKDGNMNIYKVDSDGSNVTQLTHNPGDDAAASPYPVPIPVTAPVDG